MKTELNKTYYLKKHFQCALKSGLGAILVIKGTPMICYNIVQCLGPESEERETEYSFEIGNCAHIDLYGSELEEWITNER